MSGAIPGPVTHDIPEPEHDIAQTIIGLIAAQKSLPPESITPASTFDELQMDSLDKINLSFEVEEYFKISIPDDALNSLRNVADVIAGVQRLQSEAL